VAILNEPLLLSP